MWQFSGDEQCYQLAGIAAAKHNSGNRQISSDGNSKAECLPETLKTATKVGDFLKKCVLHKRPRLLYDLA
jgi:hypothetical protein